MAQFSHSATVPVTVMERKAGGRPHYIYPQHQLVQRLCKSLTEAGGEVRFGQVVRAARHGSGGVVLSVDGPGGDRSQIECEVAVGCGEMNPGA